MNTKQFMKELKKSLKGFPEEESNNCLEFYKEYFAEAENPEEALTRLDSPRKIALNLMNENNVTVPIKQKEKLENSLDSLPFDLKQKESLQKQFSLVLLFAILYELVIAFCHSFVSSDFLMYVDTGAPKLPFYITTLAFVISFLMILSVKVKKGEIAILKNKYVVCLVLLMTSVWLLWHQQQIHFHGYWQWIWVQMPHGTNVQEFVQLLLISVVDGYVTESIYKILGCIVLPFNIILNVISSVKSRIKEDNHDESTTIFEGT